MITIIIKVWTYFYKCRRSIIQIVNNFIRNRQRKRSFPACGVAVKWHFIVPRQAAEKFPKGVPPLDPGVGPRPPDRHGGLRPLDLLPPFRNVKFVMTWCDITSHIHVRSTIKRNLTSSSWQTNSRFLFLFQIKYCMYLGSQTVFTRMQF